MGRRQWLPPLYQLVLPAPTQAHPPHLAVSISKHMAFFFLSHRAPRCLGALVLCVWLCAVCSMPCRSLETAACRQKQVIIMVVLYYPGEQPPILCTAQAPTRLPQQTAAAAVCWGPCLLMQMGTCLSSTWMHMRTQMGGRVRGPVTCCDAFKYWFVLAKLLLKCLWLRP